MVFSMTGFGKSEAILGEKKIHVEIKSLNSKNLDICTRIANIFSEHELEIRSLIGEKLLRGKIDFTLWIEDNGNSQAPLLNADIIAHYLEQIRNINQNLNLPEPSDWWSILSKMPGVTQQQIIKTASDEDWNTVKGTIEEAIQHLLDFRRQEGEAVRKKFHEKLKAIGQYLKEVEQYESARISKIREQIENGLKQLHDVEYDKGRLEQEMIYYIEKLDVNEEKQRLANHLRYFADTMETDGPIGKKMGFIAQEMGREINTLGSKSNLAEMQNIVVRMKDELEQIKEQVLNVL